MRSKPSASTIAYESIIMWSNNKTSTWLASPSPEDHQSILDDARKNAPAMQSQIKLKQQALYTGKLEHLRERQKKKEKQEEKAHATKVKLTQKLTEVGGLWVSEQQLTDFKTEKSEKMYKVALIAQISFRKSVLNSKGPKELFQQQHKGKVLTISELEENLKQIMALNDVELIDDDQPKLIYKPQEEVAEAVTNLKSRLQSRVEEGRKKIIILQQKNLLPTFLENPHSLEGKSVKHKCRDPETRVIEWFAGTVVKVFKVTQNKSRTEFTIKYDEDPENEWIFPLLKDMENGDLIIVE